MLLHSNAAIAPVQLLIALGYRHQSAIDSLSTTVGIIPVVGEPSSAAVGARQGLS